MRVGTAGFAYLCLLLQDCAEWGHIECRQVGAVPSVTGKAIPPLSLAVMSGGPMECMSAAGPPSIEHTMITISCYVLCEVLACLLNKDFLAKKVRDPSHVRWMGAL